jgi:hypothetical protein
MVALARELIRNLLQCHWRCCNSNASVFWRHMHAGSLALPSRDVTVVQAWQCPLEQPRQLSSAQLASASLVKRPEQRMCLQANHKQQQVMHSHKHDLWFWCCNYCDKCFFCTTTVQEAKAAWDGYLLRSTLLTAPAGCSTLQTHNAVLDQKPFDSKTLLVQPHCLRQQHSPS